MDKLDLRKKYPEFYLPKAAPAIIDVPAMNFIMVDGKGNPNDTDGEYKKAVELLYAFSYTIKMGLKAGLVPEGYIDYTVPPLEGLWWFTDPANQDITKKDNYSWCSMIRQPDFITEQIFEEARNKLRKKKPELNVDIVRFEAFREGLCVHALHIGPYDTEPATIRFMEDFRKQQGFLDDIGSYSPEGKLRTHHEIYLSNPLQTKPSKLKTILRHPIRRADW